jgi:hypothetical protein
MGSREGPPQVLGPFSLAALGAMVVRYAGKQKWMSPSSASIGVAYKLLLLTLSSQPLAADTCNGRAASVPANDVS